MKISFSPGRKTPNDRIILIEAQKESIGMMDVASLVNQFALNELVIIDEKEKLSRDNHYWFPKVMERALEDAEKGIDWLKCDKEILKDLKDAPFFIKDLDKFLENRNNED